MTGKGSKNKGSKFENDISKLLDEWWRVPPKTFYRSKLSGGSNEPGDITPRLIGNNMEIWWPFAVECKHHKDIKFLQLFESTKYKDLPLILQWWRQITNDVKDTSKWRLLVFRGNNTPILVMFTISDMENKFGECPLQEVTEMEDLFMYNTPAVDDVLYIRTWKEFSSKITKDALMKLKEQC